MQKLRNFVTGIFVDNLLSIHLKKSSTETKISDVVSLTKIARLEGNFVFKYTIFYFSPQFLFKKEPRCRSPYADYDTACKTTKSLFVSRQDKRLGFSKASGWQQIFYRVVACG
jgi:hypothetical protein